MIWKNKLTQNFLVNWEHAAAKTQIKFDKIYSIKHIIILV